MTSHCFAFLDSRRITSQTIQQLVMRDYALRNDLIIDFVGAEIQGMETQHNLFISYINTRKSSRFIFFTIYQFMDLKNYFDLNLVRNALRNNISLYFSNENIQLHKESDLDKVIVDLRVSEYHLSMSIDKIRNFL